MAKVRLSQATTKAAMQSPAVRAALRAKAATVAPDVAAEAPGNTSAPEVSEGTRPAGRPYARVSIEKDPQMDIVETRQAMDRVAGRHNAPK